MNAVFQNDFNFILILYYTVKGVVVVVAKETVVVERLELLAKEDELVEVGFPDIAG